MLRILLAALVGATLVATSTTISAQPAEQGQYKLLIGFGVGGGYDIWGRTVARHMSKYIPGKPTIIINNMPGAGSLKGANYIYCLLYTSPSPRDS